MTARLGRSGWFTLAVTPVVAMLIVFLFAYDTSRATGAWPTYANPDPKTTNSWLYPASFVGVFVSFASVVTLFVALPIVRRLRLDRLDVATLLVAALGFGALVVVWSGNLGDWLLD